MKLREITDFLDRTLDAGAFAGDVSNNGLQIANRGEVRRIAVGVDGSLRFLRAAAADGADFLFCHHGISWGDSLARITGTAYAIVSEAVRNGQALYAAHIPLDAHPKYGNNARLADALGLRRRRPAFAWRGMTVGLAGELPREMAFAEFAALVRAKVSPKADALPFGAARVRRVGVVSGGAGDLVEAAAGMGLDAFLTGERSFVGYTQAENAGMNVVFAGHYATETFGPRAIAELLAARFRTPVSFYDFGIGY